MKALAICVIMIAWGVVVTLLFGACAPRQQVDRAADFERCVTAVDAKMLARVRGECPPGPFTSCPTYDAIMADWDAKAAECL